MPYPKPADLLPEIFRRTMRPGDPLDVLLRVMESLPAPCEGSGERIHDIFNPHRTPERFLDYLAMWVDLRRVLQNGTGERTKGPRSVDPGRLRELIALASHLSQWRGTAKGLLLFLRVATGYDGFHIEEGKTADQQLKPFHFVVYVPEAAKREQRLIEAILEQEKPAYTTFELIYFA